MRGVYAEGSGEPDLFDQARAGVLAADGVARGALAGVLHGLDAVVLDTPGRRFRGPVTGELNVDGMRCADGLQTLVDLAPTLDDDVWEQAFESALRKRLASVAELEAALPALARARTPGTARIRRVLALRPPGAPPTESLLETLMVQLAREVPDLGPPTRQLEVRNGHDEIVGRVDLSWEEIGLFLELDGQQHRDQPVYDARRETAVVAATGWLPGRFTWREVVHLPRTTARRLADLAGQARRRPLSTGR
ncbi:MAG: DUF559 domain-containing protein [Actinobacteria bacterium]|nr:DUF559 domain-containing protein [Actinomycetota bacterium]